MSTSTTTTPTGVLVSVDEAVKRADEAVANANSELGRLPVIFAEYGYLPNRDDIWGVAEVTVRRYRLVALIVALDNAEAFSLHTAKYTVDQAFKVKGIKSDDIREVIADSTSVRQAVEGLLELIDFAKAEKVAQAEVEDEGEGIEDEVEVEAEETDQVLRWLTAPAGPLRKVREAVQNGHVLTEAQVEAYGVLLDIVTGIAGAKSFLPVKEVVNA